MLPGTRLARIALIFIALVTVLSLLLSAFAASQVY